MNKTTVQLDAGGLLPAKTKVDKDATEQLVARSYRHPVLGDRPVIRLASDRLGEAEDLAMEPLYVGVDDRRTTAGGVVVLRQVLAQHSCAETGFVPGDLVREIAGRGGCLSGERQKLCRFAVQLRSDGQGKRRRSRSRRGRIPIG